MKLFIELNIYLINLIYTIFISLAINAIISLITMALVVILYEAITGNVLGVKAIYLFIGLNIVGLYIYLLGFVKMIINPLKNEAENEK